MNKSKLIRELVSLGKANDLLALMEGESPYTTEASEGAPIDNRLGRLWIGALYHLRFIARFGINQKKMLVVDGRVESPFPEDFEEWLNADAPGIGASDLENYYKSLKRIMGE